MIIRDDVLKNEESIVLVLRELYRRYGYTPYKMSKFEDYDLYAGNKEFLVSGNVITFTDTNGRLKALKPDVTLSIVRSSRPASGTVQKVFYNENVYRVSQRSGGFKEIMQTGLECIGAVDDYDLSEVIMLACLSLKNISEESVLNLSDLSIVSDMLAPLGLSEEKRSDALRCLSEKNRHELLRICEAESCPKEAADRLAALLDLGGTPAEVLPGLESLGCGRDEIARLSSMISVLEAAGVGDMIRFDFSVIGDMGYYNGIAFKGYVSGVPTSVITGGQYDLLLQKMGRSDRAVGFAVYLDALERYRQAVQEYDVDTLLLYDENADPQSVAGAVRQLLSFGGSVSAQKSIPEKLRYRRLAKWDEKGVTILENNA